MFKRVRATGQNIPKLVVAQRVLDKMAAAAQTHMQDETGEAMVGLLAPAEAADDRATLYVLDTISPDESAVRQFHTFQQGDDRQDELIWWLQENWRVYREKRRGRINPNRHNKWDVPLRYLGDWHKQPGYMIQPSGGDLMTALDWIEDPDNGTDFLLAPIVTLGHPYTVAAASGSANYVMIPQGDGLSARVDFWYIDIHERMFIPIVPQICPDKYLPRLPDYPWHLVNEARFNDEYKRLQKDGLFTSITLWNADDQAPLEVCFMAARVGAENVLIIITPWNYPEAAPEARIAPFVHMDPDDDMYDVFEMLWEQSEPISVPLAEAWTPERTLLDYVHALEHTLDAPAERADSTPAEVLPAEPAPEE